MLLSVSQLGGNPMPCKECDDRDREFIRVRDYRARLFREGKLTKELEERLDFEEDRKRDAIFTHRATHEPGHVFD